MQDEKRSGSLIQQTPSEEVALAKHGFHITIKLGQGGYGKVYLVDYNSIKKEKDVKLKLACKIIDFTNIKENKKKNILLPPQELKILTKLKHPNIIEIHSIFQRKLKYYIFMRYAENGDLLDFIINNGPVKESLAKVWIRQLFLAVQYLHILNIAHRDIKCENILITLTNNIKLADFGFARYILDKNNQEELSETFCGSISYASPQILTGEPYQPKITDMWSLGCVIYVMLNKSFPFESHNMKLMIDNQMNRNYKFRAKYSSKYSPEAITLVAGLLEPNETFRFKIEDALNSNWITNESRLRLLSKREFSALVKAKVIATNNNNTNSNIIAQRKHTAATGNDGFDLGLVRSSVNANKRLST